VRIYAVTSIHLTAEDLTRRQERYDLVSPPGITVELHTLGPEAPSTLETLADVRESERLVTAALRAADGTGYDALLADCLLDPGVAELSAALATPVHGLLALTLDHVHAAGQVAGVVTRTGALAAEIAARAEGYGRPLASTSVLDLGPAAFDEHTRWLAGLGKAVNELADAGAEIVINGCGAVELINARSGRVPVVDPTLIALQQLAA
jgi:allantoin racemase